MEPVKPRAPFLIQLRRESAKQPGPNVVPPGRPYLVAHIPVSPLEIEDLRLRFDDIMQSLTYREAMAWCRAWGYSYTTFLMRKYQHRRPKLEEVIVTCAWVDAGKPVEKRTRNYKAVFDVVIDTLNRARENNTRGDSAPGPSTSFGAEYPL